MALAVASINLAYATETAVTYGESFASEVTQNSRQKLAVEVTVNDAVDGKIQPVTIGYIYGGRVGAAQKRSVARRAGRVLPHPTPLV